MTEEKKIKPVYSQFILPGAILLAAILISGTLILTRGQTTGSNNIAQVGGQVAQPSVGPVDIQISADDHILGNKNAKVTIVEFADFRCPFCERWYTQVGQQLISDYVNTGKARFIFKNYAFLGPQSVLASEAAECATDQGKFWQYHDWLYGNQAPESDLGYYSKDNLVKYAGKVGLNTSQFSSCLDAGKYSKKVSEDLAYGQKIGVTGTPTTFINGQMIVGAQPYETFKTAIENALK